MASEGLHESAEDLTPQTRDLHRAIVSLMEELEAIDWYQQRDEEKEHASMVLEWIRRHDPAFDEHLKKYLFTTLPITEREKPNTAANTAEGAGRRWNG